HLSSVMVYGDPPATNSNVESGTTAPQHGTYGWVKLQQDQMVEKAAQQGLPCVILCPPNISGAYSSYLTSMLEALRARTLLLLDDGEGVINLVDVHNLCHAIELALDRCSNAARRMFITDGEDTTWRQVIDALLPVCGTTVDIPRISRADLTQLNSQLTQVPE